VSGAGTRKLSLSKFSFRHRTSFLPESATCRTLVRELSLVSVRDPFRKGLMAKKQRTHSVRLCSNKARSKAVPDSLTFAPSAIPVSSRMTRQKDRAWFTALVTVNIFLVSNWSTTTPAACADMV
jgi:hypothetical protein